jgi:hypothetical protein
LGHSKGRIPRGLRVTMQPTFVAAALAGVRPRR